MIAAGRNYDVVLWDTGATASWAVEDFLTDAGAANHAVRKLMKRWTP